MTRLSRAQVREIDRISIEEFHIPGIVLMENAARGASDVAWQLVGQQASRFVTIFCGPGNNGGDGLAIARHLHNRGLNVDIVPVFDPDKLAGDAKINWNIMQAMQIEITPLSSAELSLAGGADLVIDALLGTGATGRPRAQIAEAIHLINTEMGGPARRVLAIDVPSGLDCDTGKPPGECVRATHTVTFVAEKIGFATPGAEKFLGEVTVADIGCPREVIDRVLR